MLISMFNNDILKREEKEAIKRIKKY
jgi:hypothetical protein